MKSARVIAVTVAAVILLLGACDRKVVLTFGLPTIIGTAVYDTTALGNRTLVYAEVSNTRLLPVVAANSESLDVGSFSSSGEYMWSSIWQKQTRLESGDTCVLRVYQSDGSAESDRLVIPDKPHITSPDSNFVLEQGRPLALAWTGTAGTDRYEIELNLEYYYLDSSQAQHSFYLDTTVVLPGTTTSFALPASTIFPSYVDFVYSGQVYFYVYAVCGPCIGHECKGNVKGHGGGYFLASSEDYGAYAIGDSWRAARPRPRTPIEQARRMVERFKKEMDSR
jgi:hypothetical protein